MTNRHSRRAADRRTSSFREAAWSTSFAFVLSWMSWVFIVGPFLNHGGWDPADGTVGFFVTCFYTALSLARTYCVRRWRVWAGE